jgi:hypothetical protein
MKLDARQGVFSKYMPLDRTPTEAAISILAARLILYEQGV